MSNAILSLIGLCKKAGRLEVGEEPVGAAARARHATNKIRLFPLSFCDPRS